MGEHIWTIFSTYRLLVLRVLVVLHMSREKDDVAVWYEDSYTREILESVLEENEIEYFNGLRLQQFAWVRGILRAKMLSGLQKIVSGEAFGEEAIQQAKVIEERLTVRPWDVWHR